jgi:hypothetical protein
VRGRHCHDWRDERGVRRLRGYVGARLHRRLFVWFGAAIVFTAATVAATLHVAGDGRRQWRELTAGAERFVAGRFARVWDDPAGRDELARAMARDLLLGVRVVDSTGRVLTQATVVACPRWPTRSTRRW